MWGHAASCSCVVCRTIPRIHSLIAEVSEQDPAIVPYLGSQLRSFEADLRDRISYLQHTARGRVPPPPIGGCPLPLHPPAPEPLHPGKAPGPPLLPAVLPVPPPPERVPEFTPATGYPALQAKLAPGGVAPAPPPGPPQEPSKGVDKDRLPRETSPDKSSEKPQEEKRKEKKSKAEKEKSRRSRSKGKEERHRKAKRRTLTPSRDHREPRESSKDRYLPSASSRSKKVKEEPEEVEDSPRGVIEPPIDLPENRKEDRKERKSRSERREEEEKGSDWKQPAPPGYPPRYWGKPSHHSHQQRPQSKWRNQRDIDYTHPRWTKTTNKGITKREKQSRFNQHRGRDR